MSIFIRGTKRVNDNNHRAKKMLVVSGALALMLIAVPSVSNVGTVYAATGPGYTAEVQVTGNWELQADGLHWKYKENGVYVTGWNFINNKWYYLGADTIMLANTMVDNCWLGADGAMVEDESTKTTTTKRANIKNEDTTEKEQNSADNANNSTSGNTGSILDYLIDGDCTEGSGIDNSQRLNIL